MITISRRPLRVVALLLCITALFTTYFLFETEQNAQTKPAEPRRELRAEFAKADVVTETIRKASAELVRVPVAGPGDRQRIAERGTIIADYGSFVIAAEKERNGLSGEGSQRIETTLHLPGRTFEPLATREDFAVEPGAESEGGKGYFLVQFGATASDDWLESIREVGLEVVQYVPHQAFLVYGEHSAAVKAAGHSRVRWVGRYLPEHRLDGFARSFAAGESEMAVYDIAVFSRSDLRASSWEFRSKVGGRIIAESELANNFFNVLRVEMPVSQLENAAAMDHVFRIDPYVKPTIEDERAAQIVAGNYVNVTTLNPPGYDPLTQFGADGTNVTVMVSDDGISIPGNGGFYITANNTVDGPLRGGPSGATGGHGHINASIIAGYTPFGTLDGQGFNYGVGIAPRANIINIPFLVSGNTTTDAQAVDDALNTLGPNGVRGTISNNSWGSGTNNNSYDSYAATYDGLVRDASFASSIDPFTIIFSAGNSGLSGLTRPKVSKNTIAVANSENIRTELGSTGADNMDDLRSSSSRGIALDGRIKPDITAPGTVITGSRAGSCGSVSSCFDANHAYSTGTSHAAPQVSGAAALFTQYWKDRNGGAYPSPAMIKSAIVLSGQEMNGSLTAASTTPNGNEGWGRMNMRLMMNTGVAMKHVDQTHAFSNNGENVVYAGTVADPSKPFRVALVWTDPPGTTNPALVNNLDLTVQVGANSYKGNFFTAGVSITGGTHSVVDNVEQVRLAEGLAAGTPVTITVSATALNGDGILGNADMTDQHFALVAYNFAEPSDTAAAPFDFDGDGKTDISIFRQGPGEWWYLRSSDGANRAFQFGSSSDAMVPADYTGDGKADLAFWRPASGEWFVLRSEDSTFFSFPFGAVGDVPSPSDFDGDGKADAAVFRAASGTWFILRSSGGVGIEVFGTNGDLPAVADYDGDGRADIGVFRPNGASGSEWWINRSTAGLFAVQFGSPTDRTVQGDHTGDGKADIAFYRPSTGEWYVLRSEDTTFFAFPFGAGGDAAVPGDYDGDGKTDAAVFRPGSATWFVNRSTGGVGITGFGLSTDVPVPSAYVR